ncbi:MAG TPA: hypothetical protein VM261_20210 [Kofleriaceae bacterium]|nr:hypothetical protein [Kofleriaceae bacterium]
MILILSGADDLHADHVAEMLRCRSAPVVRFDPASFPSRAQISLAYSPSGRNEAVLYADGSRMDLAEVSAVWYRRPGAPVAHAEIRDSAARAYIELECSMVMQDLWSLLCDTWLPGRPLAVRRAEQKAFQLKTAASLGFELPPTVITNRPDELLELYRKHDGLVVSKQAATAFPSTVGFGMVRFTELVTTRDVAHAQTLSYCPMILQAYVPKRMELRITVVGRRVFAAEIHSQANNRTRHDWRRYHLARTPHLPHELPRDVERRCVGLVEALGLQYGAIDMIVTPDGRYVFVEINPNGQYLWIEYQTGLPISEAICDLLLDETRERAVA